MTCQILERQRSGTDHANRVPSGGGGKTATVKQFDQKLLTLVGHATDVLQEDGDVSRVDGADLLKGGTVAAGRGQRNKSPTTSHRVNGTRKPSLTGAGLSADQYGELRMPGATRQHTGLAVDDGIVYEGPRPNRPLCLAAR